MFQSLRQNSPIYIFHKGNNPFLERGIITNVPVAKPKYQTSPIPQYNPLEFVVDLIVKVNEGIVNYNGIPAQADIADTYSNGESIVISDSRDAINSEVYSYRQHSVDIINSIESHQLIILKCDSIITDLNPEYAQKQLQQEELTKLKEQMQEMARSMLELMETNSKLVEKLNKKEK